MRSVGVLSLNHTLTMPTLVGFLLLCLSARASECYKTSLQVLATDPTPSVATHSSTGKNYFMLGVFRLLRKYLQAGITPDDPPKQAAKELLQQALRS